MSEQLKNVSEIGQTGHDFMILSMRTAPVSILSSDFVPNFNFYSPAPLIPFLHNLLHLGADVYVGASDTQHFGHALTDILINVGIAMLMVNSFEFDFFSSTFLAVGAIGWLDTIRTALSA